MRLEFFVPGDAKSSGSKRAFLNKNSGKIIVAPDNPKQKDWQAAVKWFAMQAANRMVPLSEPVVMTCRFWRERPKGHYRTIGGRPSRLLKPGCEKLKPGSKPDELKLCRAVEDAVSKIIYNDDALICDHNISKRYCDNGQVPGVQVIIETYNDQNERTEYGNPNERAVGNQDDARDADAQVPVDGGGNPRSVGLFGPQSR